MRPLIGALVFIMGLPAVASAGEPQLFSESFFPVSADRDEATLAFTGDTLIHMSVSAAAARNGVPYDFDPMFDDVRHLISGADLAICHLEVPLHPESQGLSGFPLFNAPADIAPALAKAGYDGCSTASNHSFDQRVSGVLGTLDVLESAGLEQAGMASSSDRKAKVALYELGGLTVGHVSGTYWLNGLRMPDEMPWLVQLLDPAEMILAAELARAWGADLVVASMHCCIEYRSTPTERQLEISHQLIGSDAIDLVVTHHSHVVGPVEQVGDEYIIHGLGNFLSAQRQFPALSDGVIAFAHATRSGDVWRFDSVEVVPTEVTRYKYRVVVAEPGSPSFERTMAAVNSMDAGVGVFVPPGLTLQQLRMIE